PSLLSASIPHTATPHTYTPSLHDALPISSRSLVEVAELGDTLHFSKLISAGSTVTATVEFDGRRGVALADFGRDRKRVSRLRLLDRKSTRLNSSHVSISYAVFCLKKKTAL